jgi:uncharacterized protein with GYD domain
MSTYVFRIKGTTDALRGVLAEGFPARAANAKKMVEAMGGRFVNYFLVVGNPTIALTVEFDDPAKAAAMGTAITAGDVGEVTYERWLPPDEAQAVVSLIPSYRPPGK